MNAKKSKPTSERKPTKRKSKVKGLEESKSIKQRIIEEHLRGMETPLIARLLSVSTNMVTKVVYLYKRSKGVIIKPPQLNEEEAGLNAVDEKEYKECQEILKKDFPSYNPNATFKKGDPFPPDLNKDDTDIVVG